MDAQRRRSLLFFGLFCCALALFVAKFIWPQFSRAVTASPLGVLNTTTPPAPSGPYSRDVLPENDPDINIRLRGKDKHTGWTAASFPPVLQDHSKFWDYKAPQLSTLFGDPPDNNPSFGSFYQVLDRNGGVPDASNASVPGMEAIPNAKGKTLFSPKQGYELSSTGYSYVILYATPTDIVIHDTTEDGVAGPGYTLHLLDINVNDDLVKMYNENEKNGRKKLLAIPCNFPLGTAGDGNSLMSIRDSGSFMDIRYNDWWSLPIINICKNIPPGFIDSAAAPEKPATYFEYNIQRANTSTVLNNLLDEYSVSCLPKEEYKLSPSNIQKCQAGAACPEGWRQWNVAGDLKVSADNKLFGLFRDEKSATQRFQNNTAPTSRFESLETFLGVKYPSQQVPAGTDPNSFLGTRAPSETSPTNTITTPSTSDVSVYQAPLYKLTSQVDQCKFVQKKLAAVEELCKQSNQIEGVDTTKIACGLNAKIPGTANETNLSLWGKVKNLSCETFMPNATSDSDKQLKQEILDTPLILENAYRPAFIVAVTKFDGNGLKDNNVFVDTEEHPPVPGSNFVVVDYLEVKVPAFGSDFINPTSTKSNPTTNNDARNSYKDPLRLTADAITTLKQQDDFQKLVDQKREKLRTEVESPTHAIIGGNVDPILCYKGGKLVECKAETNSPDAIKKGDFKDTIPNALYKFINANGAVNSSLPCEANEKDFYDPTNAKKIAEQAKEIGVFLTPANKMGDYTKKTDSKVAVNVNIKDFDKGASINTHTQLYFVSPDQENIQFARDSFFNFLTLEDQSKLASLGVLNDNKPYPITTLDQSVFPPLLKTDLNDSISDHSKPRAGREKVTGPIQRDKDGNVIAPQFTYGITFDPVDTEAKHPLFVQLAGQVASLPTRLMALVTSPIDSALNNYTLGCTSADEPNEFATEDWLLGRCKTKTDNSTTPPPPAVCKAGDTITSVSNDEGRHTQMSDGVIALALQVSKYTCTPAEVLVGIMSQETGGVTYTNFSKNNLVSHTISGDPNEKIMTDYRCQTEANLPNVSCGPYSWTLGYYRNVYNHGDNQQAIQDCVTNLRVALGDGEKSLNPGDPDPRILGQAMCATSANFWRSYNKGAGMPSCSGANQKAYSLKDVPQSGTDLVIQGFYGGTTEYGGFGRVRSLYMSLINGYSSQVEKVRGDMAKCEEK